MMAFFLFQRCGEILFENPDQNVKCVCMLGKKISHFKSVKHVDVMWATVLLPYWLSPVHIAEGTQLFYRFIGNYNTFICGTLDDKERVWL